VQAIYGKKDSSGSSGSMPSTAPNATQSPAPTTPTSPETSTTASDEFTTLTPAPGNPSEVPDLCKDSKFDAITALADGSVYAFKGKV